MTDNEIIKALECCKDSYSSKNCVECPYYCCNVKRDCVDELNIDALDLINRQQAEIEKEEYEIKARQRIKKDRSAKKWVQMEKAKTK